MSDSLIPLISAASGLLGVGLGGWLTSRNQKRERQHRFIEAHLGEFYGPMLALRAQILAKSETREKVSGAADRAWRGLMTYAQQYGVETVHQIREERFPDFQRIIEYNNRQLVEELMPCYRRMVELFTDKMHLAEQSTRAYFGALVEFVEVWNRWLGKSLPAEVVGSLGHGEDNLQPFYRDLAQQFERLQISLKE